MFSSFHEAILFSSSFSKIYLLDQKFIKEIFNIYIHFRKFFDTSFKKSLFFCDIIIGVVIKCISDYGWNKSLRNSKINTKYFII